MRYLSFLACATGACAFGLCTPVSAQNDKDVPESAGSLGAISVEALAFDDRSPDQAIEPATVVGGRELIRKRGQTLGQSLAETPGISTAVKNCCGQPRREPRGPPGAPWNVGDGVGGRGSEA